MNLSINIVSPFFLNGKVNNKSNFNNQSISFESKLERQPSADSVKLTKAQKDYREFGWMCSRKRNEDGTFVSGLIRPLSIVEARKIYDNCEYSYQITKQENVELLNFLIQMYDETGFNLEYLTCTWLPESINCGEYAIYKIHKKGIDKESARYLYENVELDYLNPDDSVIDRYIELTTLEGNEAYQKQGRFRKLDSEEAVAAINAGLSDKQVGMFVNYMTFDKIAPDDAVYLASFYTEWNG